MFGSIGMPELMIIFVIALIIFGPRKLPELGRSMGKSLSEFKRASNDLRCEACTMIAVVRREQGRHDEAADAYRAAIEAVQDGGDEGLRYDLAETLAEAGDHAAALEAYRALSEADPAFRDVAERIAELESR